MYIVFIPFNDTGNLEKFMYPPIINHFNLKEYLLMIKKLDIFDLIRCMMCYNLQVKYIFVVLIYLFTYFLLLYIRCTSMNLVFHQRKVQIPTTINFTDFSATYPQQQFVVNNQINVKDEKNLGEKKAGLYLDNTIARYVMNKYKHMIVFSIYRIVMILV